MQALHTQSKAVLFLSGSAVLKRAKKYVLGLLPTTMAFSVLGPRGSAHDCQTSTLEIEAVLDEETELR
jgi:hypothetical protein